MDNADCEIVTWTMADGAAPGDDGDCTLFNGSVDTADKTCGLPGDTTGGRKCHAERECQPLQCDMCSEHGYTFNEGCTYDSADDMDAGARNLNVVSYEDCTSLCTNTAGCAGVTYFSKYYASTEIDSGVTNNIAADGLGPMLCILKKQTTGGLTCDTMSTANRHHYQEVVSGEPCTTAVVTDPDFNGQTICNNLCDTCYVRNADGIMDGLAQTKEYDCIHEGTTIDNVNSIATFELCLAECDANPDCNHVRYTPATSTAVGETGTWGVIAANDCELFSNSVDASRTCNEKTVGQITARKGFTLDDYKFNIVKIGISLFR